jgi:hypothetical protein
VHISGEEARRRALEKVAELVKLSEDLCLILKDIPLPTPAEFEEIRSGRMPWTSEAYIAAVIRDADYHVDEARVILEDYGVEDAESLRDHPWRDGPPIWPGFERSLRYLVEERSGQRVAPSQRETLYYKPHATVEALVRVFSGRLTAASQALGPEVITTASGMPFSKKYQ